MNIKQLLEKRAALLAEINKPETDEKRFAEIQSEIAKINFTIEQLKADEARAAKDADEAQKAAEQRAAREPSSQTSNPANKPDTTDIVRGMETPAGMETRAAMLKKREERAKDLQAGKMVKFESRAVTSDKAALATHASSEIVPAFEQVGTIDMIVDNEVIDGGEAYKVAFEKTIGMGGITDETTEYTDADPDFDYAEIGKNKITAYCEVSEETLKLPAAEYDAKVEAAVIGAVRKKAISQVFRGTGNKQFVGIFNAPANIIDADQTKTIATIDENTLDEFIFDYGGDETVESDAVLFLNKKTLKNFATVRLENGTKAYEIKINGNSGTINGIPFVTTSAVSAFDAAGAGVPYLTYGKLSAYKITYFSPYDVQKSTDYKFKEGMIAYKVSVMAGGSPVMYNGFINVIKSAT